MVALAGVRGFSGPRAAVFMGRGVTFVVEDGYTICGTSHPTYVEKDRQSTVLFA
jgi:NurA-like 5'-3' nuclease